MDRYERYFPQQDMITGLYEIAADGSLLLTDGPFS